MKNTSTFVKMMFMLPALMLLHVTLGSAQTGTLRGGSMVLSNGTNSVTLTSPAAPTSYSLTFPTSNGLSPMYFYNDGTGKLGLGIPTSAAANTTALYNTSTPQTVTNGDNSQANDLFNVGYTPGGTGSAVGALINVVANGPSNTTLSGLTDTARNIYTAALNATNIAALPDEIAVGDTVKNSGSGTQIGLQVSVTGGGNNYAAVTTSGLVGIGTNAPTDSLEVAGNIRISGLNGLKITEGTNATMGTATLNGINAVVVNTNVVTANSRIFLTTFGNPTAVPIGTPYVSARTAGTSFSIKSSVALDANKVAWIIIEP